MAYEKDPDELGALWMKTGGKGEYMTGEINGVKVVCFRTQKRSDKSPDWRVMKSKPRDRRQDDTPLDMVNEVGVVTTPGDDGIPF
jgi:hypothetical protein